MFPRARPHPAYRWLGDRGYFETYLVYIRHFCFSFECKYEFKLSLITLNANSLLKDLPNSCGELGNSLCNHIRNNAAIFCFTDSRVDSKREYALNTELSKGASFGRKNMKTRVFTTINKESVNHKNHFAGVTTLFSEKLDAAFEFVTWYPDTDFRPRFGIAIAKLTNGPRIIIASIYGKNLRTRES